MRKLTNEKRSAPRHVVDFNARLLPEHGSQNVELLDLSATGCRVRIRDGFAPPVGARVTLQMLNGERFSAQVVWLGDQDCGMSLDSPIDPDDYRSFDELGAEFYLGIRSMQLR